MPLYHALSISLSLSLCHSLSILLSRLSLSLSLSLSLHLSVLPLPPSLHPPSLSPYNPLISWQNRCAGKALQIELEEGIKVVREGLITLLHQIFLRGMSAARIRLHHVLHKVLSWKKSVKYLYHNIIFSSSPSRYGFPFLPGLLARMFALLSVDLLLVDHEIQLYYVHQFIF